MEEFLAYALHVTSSAVKLQVVEEMVLSGCSPVCLALSAAPHGFHTLRETTDQCPKEGIGHNFPLNLVFWSRVPGWICLPASCVSCCSSVRSDGCGYAVPLALRVRSCPCCGIKPQLLNPAELPWPLLWSLSSHRLLLAGLL